MMMHPQVAVPGRQFTPDGFFQTATFGDNPAVIPMPQWCQKERAQMPAAAPTGSSSEDLSGQLQNTIAELLKLYSGSSAGAAAGTTPGTDGRPSPISIGDALAQEQNPYAFGLVQTAAGLSARVGSDDTPPRPRSESPEPEPSPASSVDGKENFDLAKPVTPGLVSQSYQGSSGSEPEREQGTQDLSGEPSVDPEMQRAREVAAAGGGLSGHTTIMIRHIPSKYTQSKLMNEINSVGFDGTYDFFYLPIDTRNHGNRGFGFINFLSARLAEEFYSKYHGQKLKHFDATTPIAVMPADVQGFEESAERFFASGHLRKKKSHSEPVFLKPLPAHLREEGRRKGRTHARDSQGAAQKEKQKSSPAQIAHHVPLQMEAPHMPAMIGGPLGLPPSTMPPRFCQTCGNWRVVGHAFCPYCGDRLHC
mmetsp:Transcript_46249/g.86326  ORF Transcript_46249/g.86326 Transcript_46249/m.86326 type:complete len:420 (-) Transcript_46249:54-1313(-)